MGAPAVLQALHSVTLFTTQSVNKSTPNSEGLTRIIACVQGAGPRLGLNRMETEDYGQSAGRVARNRDADQDGHTRDNARLGSSRHRDAQGRTDRDKSAARNARPGTVTRKSMQEPGWFIAASQ